MSDIVKILPYCVDLGDMHRKTELHTIFVMNESMAHRFEIEIKSGGKAVDLSGRTVTASFTNFRENTTIEMNGEVKDGKAVVTLEKPCYTLRGQFMLIVMVKDGDADVAVFLGEGHMRASRAEKIVYDDYVVYDVDTLLSQIASMKTASSAANMAAQDASTAAENANNAAQDASTAAAAIDGMTVSASSSATAGATISERDGVKHIAFALPKGDKGDKGEPGTIENATITSIEGLPEALDAKQPKGDYLPADGTAADSTKLGGIGASEYALKTSIPEAYTLPTATDETLGGVKSSEAVTVGADGTMTVNQLNGKSAQQYALKSDLPTKAEDVGARPDDWMPTAADVGALTVGGTAADSAKLGGVAATGYLAKDNTDYIVEQGTSGVWGYRKWNSGLAECWFCVKHTVDSFETVWGNMYESDEYFPTYAFPFTIYDMKTESICATFVLGVFVAQRARADLQASPPLIFVRPQKTTSGGTATV